MNDTPTTTTLPQRRPRGVIHFCLAPHPDNSDLICTRDSLHDGHCCDEISRGSWDKRGRPANCRSNHDHSREKGLVRR